MTDFTALLQNAVNHTTSHESPPVEIVVSKNEFPETTTSGGNPDLKTRMDQAKSATGSTILLNALTRSRSQATPIQPKPTMILIIPPPSTKKHPQ